MKIQKPKKSANFLYKLDASGEPKFAKIACLPDNAEDLQEVDKAFKESKEAEWKAYLISKGYLKENEE